MSEYRKHLAELYLRQFHEKATASNKLLFLWIGALTIAWLVGLEPKVPQLQQLEAEASQLRNTRVSYLRISSKEMPELVERGRP